ncbi:MAG: HAD-IC family P-type ATPase [Clostridia bacterium]|nr:HAD-IC family P-type ATPase [Clostridia bacterium]
MKKQTEITVERINADPAFGLSENEVYERTRKGKTNAVKNKNSKSYLKIVFDNVCTFYNLLCLACFITLLTVHTPTTPLSNYAFIIIYLVNIGIGIFQEVRAKRTLDKLSLVSAPYATAIRNGNAIKVPVSKLVLDDVVVLSLGEQIPADCIVISGSAETDESLLTGESVAVKKNEGDVLLGGSFVTGGKVVARVDKVGADCYVQTLAKKAKKFRKTDSELLRTMKRIINVVGILIVPLAVFTGIINYNFFSTQLAGFTLKAETIKRTIAVIIGMIPGGMFLLTTVALAVGIVSLAKKNTLVQDMYSLEMLARVNVLCLDKTGTITDGNLKVAGVFAPDGVDRSDVIANMELALGDDNPTARALKKHFVSDVRYETLSVIPFNSARKFSAVSFKDFGGYMLGAPEFICKDLPTEFSDEIKTLTSSGKRVVLLAKYDGEMSETADFSSALPLALVYLEDNVRPEAIETIKWFKENDVSVRVISGDDPATVSHISAVAGVDNAENYVSLAGASDEEVIDAAGKYTVFGRVSPEQKALLIKTLRSNGACVAMTGDGVNDILAMKEADCSVTVASGNSSTRSLAHLVLLTNDFNCMPEVVKEGRKVINNVERSSALYLMKTVFTILLALASIIIGTTYPLTTGNMLALESLIIGLPSLALSVQPNNERVKGKFIHTVLANALPGTFVLLFNVLLAKNLRVFGLNEPMVNEVVTVYALTFGGLAFLTALCMPLDKFRTVVVMATASLVMLWALVLSVTPLFRLPPLSFAEHYAAMIFIAVLFIVDIPIAYGVRKLLHAVFSSDK